MQTQTVSVDTADDASKSMTATVSNAQMASSYFPVLDTAASVTVPQPSAAERTRTQPQLLSSPPSSSSPALPEADELLSALSQVPYLSTLVLTPPRLIYQPPTVLQLRNAGALNLVALAEAYSGLPTLHAQTESGPYARPFSVPYPDDEDSRLESLWPPEPIDWDAVVSELHHAGGRRATREEEVWEEAFWEKITVKRRDERDQAECAQRDVRRAAQRHTVSRASVSSVGGSTMHARGPPSVFESAFNTPMSRQPSLTASAHTPIEALALGQSPHRRRGSVALLNTTTTTTNTAAAAASNSNSQNTVHDTTSSTAAQRTAKGLLRRARYNGAATAHRGKSAQAPAAAAAATTTTTVVPTLSVGGKENMLDGAGFRFPILSVRSLTSTVSAYPDHSALSITNSSEMASFLTPNTARTGVTDGWYSPVTVPATQTSAAATTAGRGGGGGGGGDASCVPRQSVSTVQSTRTNVTTALASPVASAPAAAATTTPTAIVTASITTTADSTGASAADNAPAASRPLLEIVSTPRSPPQATRGASSSDTTNTRETAPAKRTRGRSRSGPPKGAAAGEKPTGPPKSRASSRGTRPAATAAAPEAKSTSTTRASRVRLPPLSIPAKLPPESSQTGGGGPGSTMTAKERSGGGLTPLKTGASYYSDGSAPRSLRASGSTMVLAPEPLPTGTSDSGSRGTTQRSHPNTGTTTNTTTATTTPSVTTRKPKLPPATSDSPEARHGRGKFPVPPAQGSIAVSLTDSLAVPTASASRDPEASTDSVEPTACVAARAAEAKPDRREADHASGAAAAHTPHKLNVAKRGVVVESKGKATTSAAAAAGPTMHGNNNSEVVVRKVRPSATAATTSADQDSRVSSSRVSVDSRFSRPAGAFTPRRGVPPQATQTADSSSGGITAHETKAAANAGNASSSSPSQSQAGVAATAPAATAANTTRAGQAGAASSCTTAPRFSSSPGDASALKSNTTTPVAARNASHPSTRQHSTVPPSPSFTPQPPPQQQQQQQQQKAQGPTPSSGQATTAAAAACTPTAQQATMARSAPASGAAPVAPRCSPAHSASLRSSVELPPPQPVQPSKEKPKQTSKEKGTECCTMM